MKHIVFSLLVFLISCGLNAVNLKPIDNRIRIVVLDTGVSKSQTIQPYMCKDGVLSTLNDNGIDDEGHGTNIVGLIAKETNSKTHCIISIRVWKPEFRDGLTNTIPFTLSGLSMAISLKPQFVNVSMVGAGESNPEYDLYLQLVKNKAKVVVAAGNDDIDLDYKCDQYPACYKRRLPKRYQNQFYVISSKTTSQPNHGSIVSAYLDGKDKGKPLRSGTSQAAAIFTSALIK